MKALFLLGVLMVNIGLIGCKHDTKVFKALRVSVANYNKTLPDTNQKHTIISDSCYVIPDDTVVYLFTCLTIDSENVNINILKDSIQQHIPTSLNKYHFREFRKHHVSMIFTYRDRHKKFLLNIYITPDMYKKY
jgi:hypothetical protein